VQHILGRHAHGLGHRDTLIGAVAGMTAAKVIGHAPPDQVELDAATDAIAIGGSLDILERQHLGLQQLQLDRCQQPVLGPARPHPHKTLARDHGLSAPVSTPSALCDPLYWSLAPSTSG